MFTKILTVLSLFLISIINKMGYWGLVLLMAVGSACIPLPSEVIMPFSGYLTTNGVFNFWPAVFMGTLGCLLGSIAAYYAGLWGGRAWILKYGKYVLISHHDLDLADKWFKNHGEVTVFVGRFLPVIRAFISFPAGISKMKMWSFIIYTTASSFIWCFAFAWIGKQLGENWSSIKVYFQKFDLLIGIVLILGIFWYIDRHLKLLKKS